MKVLLINKYFYVRGGSETYYFALADMLQKAGHEVIFFSMEHEKNRPCAQSKYFVRNMEFDGEISIIEKIRLGFKMVYSFEAKKKLTKMIQDEKPDIIHINLFHRILTASIVDVAKKFHIPVVFTVHDVNCICPNHTMLDHGTVCEACLKGQYINCIKKTCLKDSKIKCLMAVIESTFNKVSGLYGKIDLFITPSEFFRQKFLESGIIKSPIICMRNFLPADKVTEGSAKNAGYYLFFGRLSPEKGVFTMLKAIASVEGTRLEIAGTGPAEEEMKAFVQKNGLEDRVIFKGFMAGESLKEEVRNAKCVILPSEWYENAPYTVVESMTMGKPVIAAGIGGLPEIVLDGQTGYVSKAFCPESLGDCIRKMEALDDASYKKMSDNAIRYADEWFNADKYLEDLLKQYEALLHAKEVK